jgi:hypothetical protein
LDDVRRRIEVIESRWNPNRYTAQHFYSTYLLAMLDLCSDRPADAAQRLARCKSDFRRAGGARAPVSRIDYALLEARIALRLGSLDRQRWGLRGPQVIAAALENESRSDGAGHAAAIRAADASWNGDVERAVIEWDRAVRAYAGAAMRLHEGCARWRRAEASADSEGRVRAAAQIQDCGVGSPQTWLCAFMPSGLASSARAHPPSRAQLVSSA